MENINRADLVSAVKNHLKNSEGGVSYDVELVDCLKANQNYTALRVTPSGERVGVSLDVRLFEKMIEDGKSLDKVADEIAQTVRRALKNAPTNGFDIETLNNYNAMKDKLILSLVGVKGNEDFLAGVPHKIVGTDLALYARYLLEDDKNGRSSIVVKNEMLTNGLSAEDVLNDAVIASPKNAPVKVKTMGGTLREIAPAAFGDPTPEEDNILVVTSETNNDGAGVIFYDGVFERLSKMLGGSFYILPSSRHEVLAVKQDTEIGTAETLLETVCEVNATAVSAEDFLADSVYYYDAESKDFRRVATKAESLAEAV